jgi:hypothetical protein
MLKEEEKRKSGVKVQETHSQNEPVPSMPGKRPVDRAKAAV